MRFVPFRGEHRRTVVASDEPPGGAMTTRYVCDYCGHEGRVPEGEMVDRIQCPMCGEPVTPLD